MRRAVGLLLAAGTMLRANAAGAACESGLYGVVGREAVAITNPLPSTPTTAARYSFLDGRRGNVDSPDSPVRCEQHQISVRGADGAFHVWEKIPISTRPTHFTSHRTEMTGALITLENDTVKRPLVVLVHGSEKTSMRVSYYPALMAAQGLMVFAYDKRGTGDSGGDYTQNFELLADDAAAALVEARRLAAGRESRAGYFGGSQGGWVAPLAATHGNADFVAVGFGLVLSPLEEDQEQVASELRRKGYSDAVLAHARQVTDATGEVIASHFTGGFEPLAAVKQRYAAEPWLQEIRGEFTGDILADTEADLRRTGAARLDNLGLIWKYDSAAVIGSLRIPQLWVLAEMDREAPSQITRERLLTLVRAGTPIDVYVFPQTDHGMYEFVEDPDGTRHPTRITDGYFRLVGDWIRGDLGSSYGRGVRIDGRK